MPLAKQLSEGTYRSRTRQFIATVAFAAVLLPAAVSAATETYYRWLDGQGKLVVSDRPPQDSSIEYEVVSQRTSLIRRVGSGEGAVPAEVTPRPGNEFEQVDEAAEESGVEKNPENCARARANIETLDSAARIRIRDEDTGEIRFISDDEREDQRQKALAAIEVNC